MEPRSRVARRRRNVSSYNRKKLSISRFRLSTVETRRRSISVRPAMWHRIIQQKMHAGLKLRRLPPVRLHVKLCYLFYWNFEPVMSALTDLPRGNPDLCHQSDVDAGDSEWGLRESGRSHVERMQGVHWADNVHVCNEWLTEEIETTAKSMPFTKG